MLQGIRMKISEALQKYMLKRTHVGYFDTEKARVVSYLPQINSEVEEAI